MYHRTEGRRRCATLCRCSTSLSALPNNLTYKAVIENLNVLDYDYYFRSPMTVLAGHTAQVLLAFDEVLANGLTGHHFSMDSPVTSATSGMQRTKRRFVAGSQSRRP